MFKCRDEVSTLPPYELGGAFAEEMKKYGVARVVKLNSNEGPYPPFPAAIEAMQKAAASSNRYPDPSSHAVRLALAEKYSVPAESIAIGPGSVMLIRALMEVAINPGDEVIIPWPSFPPYLLATHIMGGRIRKVPLVDHTHDLPAMLAAITDKTKVIVICNPNNPTSTIITKSALDDYFEKVPAHILTILDEAYIDYIQDKDCPDGLDYLQIGKPVAVLRTFSKIYGLAGLRVGYGFTSPELAETLRRVQEGFPVSHVAQAAALASLERGDLVAERARLNAEGLAYFAAEFDKLGLSYAKPFANFAFVDVRQDAREMFQKLMRQGVLVRPGATYDSPTYERVTVGTPEENEIFTGALKKALEM